MLVEDADVSITASTNGYAADQIFPLAVRETRAGETREIRGADLPMRFLTFYRIPLYLSAGSGRGTDSDASGRKTLAFPKKGGIYQDKLK
ncbi:MAG: hypothetical protein IJ240_09115 [Clostridia bacterium]|nr:hypothetical protein [Clostridia bacterium]